MRDVDEAERALVIDVHAAPAMLVYEFAGAGVGALAALHAVGGSSRTVLEAVDRYAPRSLAEAVGMVHTSVSPEVAGALARHALRRARHLAGPATAVVGIGCTATIATDRVKRGQHRACVAAAAGLGVHHLGITLGKGERERGGEESLVSELVLDAIASAAGLLRHRTPELIGDELVDERFDPAPPFDALLDGEAQALVLELDGTTSALDWTPGEALVSGSFNPLHDGHLGLAAAAERHLGRPVRFELSVTNAEKPPLTPLQVHRRASQFPGRARLVVSRAPLFVDKAERFPGCVFVIGADTAARVLDERFYPGADGRDLALDAVRAHDARFLVAGRRSGDRFVTMTDLSLPLRHADLFEALPEAAFRSDLSSSAIRDAWGAEV